MAGRLKVYGHLGAAFKGREAILGGGGGRDLGIFGDDFLILRVAWAKSTFSSLTAFRWQQNLLWRRLFRCVRLRGWNGMGNQRIAVFKDARLSGSIHCSKVIQNNWSPLAKNADISPEVTRNLLLY